MTIVRADGVTKAERYLKSLCDQTFLSLWSYPGIYRDQGLSQGNQGKEICDLLVVFDNHIIIFSDKDCQFPNSGRIELDWNRWFKKAIKESAKQAWGAERWIKQFPKRLFLDRACSQPFPINLPDTNTAQFHLVIVAHDDTRRCYQELGGSGSLMINSSIKGDAHLIGEEGSIPFCIGDIEPNRTFVHVLDDTSLDIVMRTLDTIADFVNYLTKKEKLIRSSTVVIAAGEEDLLAYYLMNINEEEEHDFVIPQNVDGNITHLFFDEGYWEEFSQGPQRQSQISADKISYVWDHLIEKFSHHILEGTEYFSSHQDVRSAETALRFLARESRFRRRNLAKALCQLIADAPRDRQATRYIHPSLLGDPYYVFLTLPHFSSMNYEQYREARRRILEICCSVVKHKFHDAQNIVGIATEPGFNNGGRSEDVIYYNATEWKEEDEIRARELARQFDILQNVVPFTVHDQEYPV
jgi:hypothetical protein